jgi:hypothetical protein
MSKHLNIFRAGAESTFAISLPILRKLLLNPETRTSTVALYVYLVSKADGPQFRVHVGTILADTGLSRQTYLTSRDELRTQDFIRFAETQKQGVWNFELLSDTGGKLATFEDYIRFSELPNETIEAYYAHRLQAKSIGQQDGSFLFPCPFHSQARSKPTLRVTADGGEHHGRFICNAKRCGRHGGLVALEQAMAERQGQSISKTEAAQAVRSFAVSRQRGDHLPHPAILDLEEVDPSITI